MDKKNLQIIVVIILFALSGMFITHVYWATTAYKLKEEHMEHSIRIALKNVVNQILKNTKSITINKTNTKVLSNGKHITNVSQISENVLDSLLAYELSFMDLKDNYYYGIYNNTTNKFIIGNYKNNEQNLINTKYQFHLPCISKHECYKFLFYLPDEKHVLFHKMELWIFLSILFLIILIISFVFVIFTILHQKKISEVKTNFINNMTHEFKTPIATSSLAAEMIQKPRVIENPEKIKKYASIILDENNKLQNQIEYVLQVAILESGNQHFKIRKTNIHDILDAVIESLELRFKEEKVNITIQKKAQQPFIMGDKIHLINTFFNLIDNAIKYSDKNPEISINTWNENKNIVISIKDKGIGINKEYQSHIFKNLYRVPTGNLHEVRGFGLGLFYVKTVVDELWGKIELHSEPGKGSEFILYFPTINKSKNYANF